VHVAVEASECCEGRRGAFEGRNSHRIEVGRGFGLRLMLKMMVTGQMLLLLLLPLLLIGYWNENVEASVEE